MTEEFICYLWQHKILGYLDLNTTNGEPLSILKVGERNPNSGADFLNAKIKIGNTEWAGNVEIHLKSSDWYKHKHELNKAYNNVILHVVYDFDKEVFAENGSQIPCLEAKGKHAADAYGNYLNLLNSKTFVPCEKSFGQVSNLVLTNTLQRLAAERMEGKGERVALCLQATQNSWEQTFYRLLARYFGSSINSDTFEALAKSLDMQILAKHKNNLFELEALIFGVSGLLSGEFSDEYPTLLKKEFQFLQKKYGLQALDKTMWHFLRLRPGNFPTIRLSQFAAVIHRSQHLFSKILEAKSIDDLFELFNVSASPYWTTHYVFDKPSIKREKSTGKTFLENLIINVVVPILFEYGNQHDDVKYKEKALEFLEKLPKETNSIQSKFEGMGLNPATALESQGLLQLYSGYCKPKRCLNCSIGMKIINP